MRPLLACALLFSGCAALDLNLANTGPAAITQVEIVTPDGASTLPSLGAGEVHRQRLKLKQAGALSVNFVNAQGRRAYASSPLALGPGDSGWVQLSITAQGLLESADGRKGKR